jgi:hypothetical protein
MKKIFILLFFLFACAADAHAGIVLKAMAFNPSKTEKQSVPIKVYLPKEVKPEHIIDKGDLEVGYDNQQGSYFVYGQYELAPGESVEREIEMMDVWMVPAAEIESMRTELDKTVKLLAETDFRERVNFLKENIERKLKMIEENQKVESVNPERHISLFRDNQRLMESAKEDLSTARGLLAQAKPVPAAAVWRLILIIILFLGFIGVASYFIWQTQIKVISTPTFGEESREASEDKENASQQDDGKPEV